MGGYFFPSSAIPFITGFLVGWFVLAGVTGWLAGRRNRDGGFWTVLSLCFGPFAIAALLVLPRRARRPALSPLWEQLEVDDDLAAKEDQPRPDLGEGRRTG